MGKASDTVYEIRICGLLPVCRGLNQPETLAKRFHGSGMLVQMQSGKGEIAARTCEWVTGLKLIEFYTQQIGMCCKDA
jgi:hypothetical protein